MVAAVWSPRSAEGSRYRRDQRPARDLRVGIGMKNRFVNGVQVLKDGEHTGAIPGRALWATGKLK